MTAERGWLSSSLLWPLAHAVHHSDDAQPKKSSNQFGGKKVGPKKRGELFLRHSNTENAGIQAQECRHQTYEYSQDGSIAPLDEQHLKCEPRVCPFALFPFFSAQKLSFSLFFVFFFPCKPFFEIRVKRTGAGPKSVDSHSCKSLTPFCFPGQSQCLGATWPWL